MRRQVTLLSVSRAQDAGVLALADVSAVTGTLGLDHRVVGGQMVSLLVEAFGVTGVPVRDTADADLAAPFSVLADPRLGPELASRGYARTAGNRFERRDGSGAVITLDVLGPSYSGRHEPNRAHGDLVVDEVPGISLVLARQGVPVALDALLTDGRRLDADVLLPDPLAALALKALTWSSRFARRDAVDVWRLLAVAHATGVRAHDWTDGGVTGDARTVLRRSFGTYTATGARAATQDRSERVTVARLVAEVVGRADPP